MSVEPGWYHAEGDPPNTVRYWDGDTWQGGPQAPPTEGPGPEAPADPFAPTPADMVTEPTTPPPARGEAPIQTSPEAGPGIQPGWYPAAGDPPDTIRYWNGHSWEGGPQQSAGFMPGGSGAENLSPFGYVQRAYTSRYASFAGRARRAEFGWFILITWVVGLVLSGVGRSGVGSALLGLFWLAALIPYIAVAVRRLHDMNMSGWVLLVVLVPLVNFIFFLVMLFSDSQRAPNKWGRSPKYG